MVAYLIAGLLVGALGWVLRHGPEYPRLPTLAVYGLAGGAIGGLGSNLIHDEGIDHLDPAGFTAAVLVALAIVVGVHVRAGRTLR